MNNAKISVFTAFIFIFLTGCTGLQKLASIQKPTVTVSDIRLNSISLSEVELTFHLIIDNPNPVSVTVNSYDYEFLISDNSFISGNTNISSTVQPADTNRISVPVKFTFEELFNTYGSLREQDEITFSFVATTDIMVPVLGTVQIPMEKTGSFPVIKIPRITLAGFRVNELSTAKADLELEIRVNNPNAFGMKLRGLNFETKLNDFDPVSGNVDSPVNIEESSVQLITIPVSLNLTGLGLSAFRLLSGGDPLTYSLDGMAEIEMDIPLFKPSTFRFSRTGEIGSDR